MGNKILVELIDKLYNNEIDMLEFKQALKDNGYNLSAGLTMEAFNADFLKRKVVREDKPIGFFKKCLAYLLPFREYVY